MKLDIVAFVEVISLLVNPVIASGKFTVAINGEFTVLPDVVASVVVGAVASTVNDQEVHIFREFDIFPAVSVTVSVQSVYVPSLKGEIVTVFDPLEAVIFGEVHNPL